MNGRASRAGDACTGMKAWSGRATVDSVRGSQCRIRRDEKRCDLRETVKPTTVKQKNHKPFAGRVAGYRRGSTPFGRHVGVIERILERR